MATYRFTGNGFYRGSTLTTDTLLFSTTRADLTSSTLSSIEILKAGWGGTTFTVNQADLTSGGSVTGSDGADVLKTVDTQLNLASTTLSSVEILQAGTTSNTTFTVNQDDLASGGSVIGNSGTDAIAAGGSWLDLTHQHHPFQHRETGREQLAGDHLHCRSGQSRG